jgi:DNA-binding transcriptional LysR family regulator
VLTPVLGEMVTRISAFEPTIRQYSSPEIYRLLLEGTIDAGLVVGREEMPERLNRWKLYDERLVALCPAKHAIAKLEEVTVARLADERILGREIPDCAIHAAIQALCASLGIEWRIHRSGSEESQLYEMVKASLGLAVVGERRPVPQGLVACPLAEIAPQSIMLAVIAGRQHGPSVTIFLKLMRARDWAN